MGDERNIDALGARMVQLGVHLAPPEGECTPRHNVLLSVAALHQGCPEAQALPVLSDMSCWVELFHRAMDPVARPQEKRRKIPPEESSAPRPWVSAEYSLQAAASGGIERVDMVGAPGFDVVELPRPERREQNQSYLGQPREIPL